MCYAQNDATRKKLEAMGWPRKKIYEAKEGETWDKITLYKGEWLGILGGLKAFGGKVKIKSALARFEKQDAVVVDLETGQNSRDNKIDMFEAATGPRRMSAEFKRKMADERAAARRESAAGMSDREIEIEWKKPGIMSADERAAFLNIPRATLYKEFGESGAKAGRRPKHLLET